MNSAPTAHYSVACQAQVVPMVSVIVAIMLFMEPQILIADCAMHISYDPEFHKELQADCFPANGVPSNPDANGLINPSDDDEDFADSFFESPSVFNTNSSTEMCAECETYFPAEDIDPDTHFCPKCKSEGDAYEELAMFANGD
jgi:hypothetical protein